MKKLYKGHEYLLDAIDNGPRQHLAFVKREGAGYPGNEGRHGGVQIQEVLRALIDRVKYVDRQIPDKRNPEVLKHLRMALFLLEERAAERHSLGVKFFLKIGERLDMMSGKAIEKESACKTCGHLVCRHE